MTTVASYPRRVRRVNARREAQRVLVVRAVFFIFLLSLIEGALRKWFLPSLAAPLTLLRDPFVLALYAYCIANGLIRFRGIAQVWIGFAFLTALLGLGQYIVNGYGLVGWMLGVRTYWLYMPLAFLVAETFRKEDVQKFIILNLWIAIPYAMLVAVQYSSPPSAFVNLGVGADEEGAVQLGDGILRPFGLFTYTGPNVDYTAAIISLLMAFYIGRTKIRWRWLFLVVTGVAIGSMAVLTGSRSIYFLAGAIILVTSIGLITSRSSSRSLTKILGIITFVAFAGLVLVSLFPDMLDAMAQRFQVAEAFEGSIWARAMSGVFAWVEPLFTAPMLGHGIGLGAPGVASFIGLPALSYGEGDLQRNLNELGLLAGLAMLALRFISSAWMLRLALRLAQKGNEIALPLAGYAFLPLAFGQITHSPLLAFLPWLFFGLTLALVKSPIKGRPRARAQA